MPALPSGVILLWFGSIASIPSGYFLCDGNNGTPDLRSRFLVGAGDTYDPGDTGGAVNHDHTFTGDGHDHDFLGGTGINEGDPIHSTTAIGFAVGTTDPGNGLPPYHALAYIMKS